jgi:SAM-dependent methyltransferase
MHCGALERHRLVWRYLRQETDLFDKPHKKVLHIAPEPCFESRLKGRLGSTYITADLNNPGVNVKMDITDIQYPDESFDVIYCSHVLEHVPDDRKAMRELCRVLKSDGWALLVVPIFLQETIEDPTITDPLERQRLFGLKDHVRKYGTDFEDRLRQAGFNVTPISASDFLQQDETRQIRINQSYRIHRCTKSPMSTPHV